MADDIREWLASLDLEHLAGVFSENQVGLRDLPLLTEDDLKDMGLALGPRRRILSAIADLVPQDIAPITDGESSETQSSVAAERRQLAVMFCDLVGSTALSQTLDPEDLREVMRRYQDAVADAVTRYGGHVAKYLGDGVLAYFGWPQAYEDQAERAVRAGLDAVTAVSNVHVADQRTLEARVGIATGQIVVGDLVGESGRDAEAVTGETPNLAARLQEVAGAGDVVVGAVTRRLIGAAFDMEDLGLQTLKGFTDRMPTWRVIGKRTLGSRFEAAHSLGLTSFVGRQGELNLLADRWALARAAQGQVVMLSGEPGIGKSRLLQTMVERFPDEPFIRLRYQCSPFYTSSALYPVIQQLERAADFARDDDNDARLDKLEALLNETSENNENVSLFAALLSLSANHRYGALEHSPQQRKERTPSALIDELLALSRSRPVLFLFEDAHWIDPTTQELLQRTIPAVTDMPVMMVVTHRPEWTADWAVSYGNVVALTLGRMGPTQIADMVRAIAGDNVMKALIDRVTEGTDGNPLYVEEFTKLALESDSTKDGDRRAFLRL